jgi:hypothetical protein
VTCTASSRNDPRLRTIKQTRLFRPIHAGPRLSGFGIVCRRSYCMPTPGYSIRGPTRRSGLRDRPNAEHIMLTKSPFVKQKSQPPEEHCPKKLLDRGQAQPSRACQRNEMKRGRWSKPCVEATIREAQGEDVVEKHNSRMCLDCGATTPPGSMAPHRPKAQVLHRRRGTLHRPLLAQAAAPGLSGAVARGTRLCPTGRPSSDSHTLWRSRCMTEYYRTLEKRKVDSIG